MASGRRARNVARKVYRRAIRTPKRILAKKYANTVGQIVRRKRGRSVRPSRGFRRRRSRRFVRRFKRRFR